MLSRKLGFKTPMGERFWQRVDKRGPDDCWVWTGAKLGKYGSIFNGKRNIGAHRASLILDGRDPGPLDALHSCHNTLCVNPAHLRPGTAKENARDTIEAGRFVWHHPGFGEKNVNSILSEQEVRQIRSLNNNGMSQTELGEKFGVDRKTIFKVVHRQTWKHVA